MSNPWVAYGQTLASPLGIINPAPSVNGVIGEIAAWPYVVPAGKVLVVKASGVEAYENVPGGIVLFVWLGNTLTANSQCLHSVFAGQDTVETVGAEYHLPAGTKVNIKLLCNENPPQVVGWYVSGELRDAS